jgi:RNA polymerase sigma-70 factor (ECF subfamily)
VDRIGLTDLAGPKIDRSVQEAIRCQAGVVPLKSVGRDERRFGSLTPPTRCVLKATIPVSDPESNLTMTIPDPPEEDWTDPERLSQISTMWTVLAQAGELDSDQAREAQLQILKRYSAAIHRYLAVSLRDPDAADELFQEFTVRFLRGDFRRADPTRGKFRHLLKAALSNLMIDYHRRKARRVARPLEEAPEPQTLDPSSLATDAEFLAIWRADLMNKAWEALADHDRRKGRHLHLVLRYRADHPQQRSAELAQGLSAKLGRPVTPEWVRKQVFLARQKFTDFLVDEVARSLDDPNHDFDALERELIDLKLAEHCRDALERRRRAHSNE